MAASAQPALQTPITSNTVGLRDDARGRSMLSVVRAPATDTGIKSFLVKKAVQLISASFRHGGDLVSEVLKFVDKKAADTAKRHSDDIANDLDRIADIPDLTSNIVKEQLYNALTRAGIDGGTALQITDGCDLCYKQGMVNMDTGDVDARLAQLEARVQELSERLTTLAVCKLADPRYPYFEWQVSHPMSAEAGEEVSAPVRAKAQQVVPDVSLDAGTPSFREIESAIREALGWRRPEQVLELLQAMHEQGTLEEFTDHALRDALAGCTADDLRPTAEQDER